MRRAWNWAAAHADAAAPVAVHLALTGLTVWLAAAHGRVSDLATQWDGEHFLRVSGGYAETSDFAFAPLWPVLIGALGGSWQAALAAAWILSAVAVALIGHVWTWRGGLLFACFPTWVAFSSMAYSEAVFVALAAAAVWALGREAYLGAGTFAALAVTSRYVGALGFVMVAGAVWHRQRRIGPVLRLVVPLLVVGVGLMVWHWVAAGGPLAYLDAQEAWDGELKGPKAQVEWLLHGWFTNQEVVLDDARPMEWVLRNTAYVVPFVAGMWLLARDGRWDLLAYCAPLVLVVVSTVGTPALSVPRLLLAAFPAIAVLGRRLPAAAVVWLAASGAVIGLSVTLQQLTGFYA